MSTVYISTTGSDSYTYVQAQNPATPWLTVGKANTSATTGDTISIADGTYTFQSVWFSSNYFNITATNLPTIDSPGVKVIMDGGSTSTPKSWRFDAATGSTVTGIRFQNYYNYDGANASYGIYTRNATTTFNNCEWTNVRVYSGYDLGGIFMLQAGGGYALNRCKFYKYYRVNPNTDPIGNALLCGSGTGSSLSMINCMIYLDGTGADQFSSTYGFVRWNSGTITTNVKNCIVRNVGTTLTNGMANAYWGTTATVTYTGYSGFSDSNAGTGNYALTSDPFVDVTNNDFRLRPSSQPVGAGTLV